MGAETRAFGDFGRIGFFLEDEALNVVVVVTLMVFVVVVRVVETS